MQSTTLPHEIRSDVEILWNYNQMHHEVRPADVGIGLGSHDLGVATHAVELYHRGIFPLIVFTGANSPTTVSRFPRGESTHYREHALARGVPDAAILVESRATDTGENIEFTRDLLEASGLSSSIESVMLISRPYQQRRSYATCRKRWPEVDVICGSHPTSLEEYIDGIQDMNRVVNMLVGDTQRIWIYTEKGWAIDQEVPDEVRKAHARLLESGFTSRYLPEVRGSER